MKHKLAWCALGAVVVIAVVALVAGSRPSNSPAARAARLEHELACPVCQGQSVADSNAPESRAIRADIPARIRAGQTDAEIKTAYVSRYGDRVLLAPDDSGLDLVAWVVPVLVLLLGGFGVGFVLWRWSRTPRLAASAEDEAIVAAAREHDPEEPEQ